MTLGKELSAALSINGFKNTMLPLLPYSLWCVSMTDYIMPQACSLFYIISIIIMQSYLKPLNIYKMLSMYILSGACD